MYIDEERGIVIIDYFSLITAKKPTEKEKRFIEYIKNINNRYGFNKGKTT